MSIFVFFSVDSFQPEILIPYLSNCSLLLGVSTFNVCFIFLSTIISISFSSNNTSSDVLNCIFNLCFPCCISSVGIVIVKLGNGFSSYVPYPLIIDIRS